nr:hypothetical protein [Tanacetum cinerariifolium]GEX78392.1 hypothetical protein [Tanacetum cinerariifolium]
MAEGDEEKTKGTEEGVYCFTYIPKELKKLRCYASKNDEKGLSQLKRTKHGNILGRNSNKKQKRKVSRPYAISKFIPKLAELKQPIREARIKMEKAKEPGWTNEAEEDLKDQKETKLVANIGHPKRRRRSNAMSTIKKRDNKIYVTGRKGRNPDTCFLFFRKHKVKVVTDGPMEETLKVTEREGRLGKWASEIRTYDISYIQRKDTKGPIVKKFFGKGEQVDETPDANKGGIFYLSKGFQAKSSPTTRVWRLYLGRRKPYIGNRIRKKVQRGNYECNGPILQVPNHKSPKNIKPKKRSVDRAGNYKARIPQPGSNGRYQNKTIDRRDK